MVAEKKKVIIVGCGPGATGYITPAATAAARKAEVLIVSKRLKGLFPDCPAERIDSGRDIAAILDTMAALRNEGKQVVLLATGDPGIASLAHSVIRHFGQENCEVIPGISSIQVAFARLGLEWQDARIITAGVCNVETAAEDLRKEAKIAILGGQPDAYAWTSGLIAALGDDRRVFLCENLTLPDEQVREITGDELRALPVSTRAVVMIFRKEEFRVS
jgi:cobalt-precorrin-7 (C5)-methyltransferase